jgi:hypothetical protein
VNFAPQTVTGVYTLAVGIDMTNPIRNTLNQPLDQNNNAVFLENPGDIAVGRVVINGLAGVSMTVNPNQTPNTTPVLSTTGVNRVTLTFNMQVSSFPLSSVQVFAPNGFGQTNVPVPVAQVVPVAGTGGKQWVVVFQTTQTRPGVYVVHVGPNVFDTAGKPMNQTRDLVLGAANDIFTSTFRIDGLRVVSFAPTEVKAENGLSSALVTFNQGVDRNSFGTNDVLLLGPTNVAIPVLNVVPVDAAATTWRVIFARQTQLGRYRLLVGPNIDDATATTSGMDQNQNGLLGEGSDVASGILTVSGLRVLSATPNTQYAPPGLSSFLVVFNEGVSLASLRANVVVTTPTGARLGLSFSDMTATTTRKRNVWRVNIVDGAGRPSPQSRLGTYTLRIAPGLRDLANIPLDQNRNFIPGQAGVDGFVSQVLLRKAPAIDLSNPITGPVPANMITFLREPETPLTPQLAAALGPQLGLPAGTNLSGLFVQKVTLYNRSNRAIKGPVALVVSGLTPGVAFVNRSGIYNGQPYRLGVLRSAVLSSFQGETFYLVFRKFVELPLIYNLSLVAGFRVS